MSQPHLIDQLIRDIGLNPKSHLPSTPAISSYILHRDEKEAAYDSNWSFRSAIGKLNYLEKGTRPGITYATHQCARFTEDPRKPQAKVVEHIIKYLERMKLNHSKWRLLFRARVPGVPGPYQAPFVFTQILSFL